MPRFFFDFHEAGDLSADTQGSEFADVEQAYLGVFRAVQEMWSELLKQRRDPRRCSFTVRNELKDILFTFPFQEVLDCCKNPPVYVARQSATVRRTLEEVAETRLYVTQVRDGFRQEIQNAHRHLRQSRSLLADVDQVS